MSWDDEDDWATITPSQEAALQALERGGGGSGGGAAPAAHYQAPPAAQPAPSPAVEQAAGPPVLVVRRRKLPAILSDDAPAGSNSRTAAAAGAATAAADENLPPAQFAGRLCYAHTGYEVDQLCQQLLQSGVPAVGLDIEWRVLYQTGVPPRPVALMQLCFRTSSQPAAAAAGGYTCLLLHICHSGVTPHLRQLLTSPGVPKVGVGIHGDTLKVQRDFGIEMQGIVCLSEYANARLVAPPPGAEPTATPAAAPGAGRAAGGPAAIAAAGLAGSGSVPLVACPQKWSLAGLVSLLLRLRLEKSQAVRCSNWEARPPLSGEQQAYAATDAWASLRVYEVLSKLPVVAPPVPPPVPAAPAGAAQQPGLAAAAAAAAMPSAADWVPACARVRHVQPAKLAVYQALVHQGLSVQAIAAQRRIQEDSVQGNMAAAIAAGLGYSWSCLGVPTPVLQQVAEVCSQLLGRPLACQPSAHAGGNQQQQQQQPQQQPERQSPQQQPQQQPERQSPQQQPQQQQCQVGTKRPPPCSPGSLAAAATEPAVPAAAAAVAANSGTGSGDDPIDLLDRLLAAGHKLRELKEGHFPEVSYGWLRLTLAHLGRCNPGPWD